MKLSEAIRLGSMLKPQSDGYFYRNGATCAQGAALDAVGKLSLADPVKDFNVSMEMYQAMRDTWPWACDAHEGVSCPCCCDRGTVLETIPHLNNSSGHSWTREAIADWVETLEAAQEHGVPASTNAVREEMEQPGVPLRA